MQIVKKGRLVRKDGFSKDCDWDYDYDNTYKISILDDPTHNYSSFSDTDILDPKRMVRGRDFYIDRIEHVYTYKER